MHYAFKNKSPPTSAQLTAEDYDLPTFGPKLKEVVKNVSLGRGFQLLRCHPLP